MSESNLSIVQSGPSDADKAAQYREQIRPLLEQATGLVNAAARDGLVINFALGRDGYGLMRVIEIQVSKPL